MLDPDYWKMKYRLLEEQFEVQRRRNEELETRIVEIVEKTESDKLALNHEIDELHDLLNQKTENAGEIRERKKPAEPTELLRRDEPLLFPRMKRCDEQDIPLLSNPEGLLFGFQWSTSSNVKIV